MKIQQILGILCIGLSIVMIVKLPNKDVDILTCDSSFTFKGCKVDRFSWRGEERVLISTTDLRKAGVERRKYKNQKSVTYLLMLYTDNESFPVSYNGAIEEKENLADRVNSFIENPQDAGFSEKIEQTHWGKWLVAPIVAVLGMMGVVNKQKL